MAADTWVIVRIGSVTKGVKKHEEYFVFLRDFLWQFNPATHWSERNLASVKICVICGRLWDG
jgi:hypothetical protein